MNKCLFLLSLLYIVHGETNLDTRIINRLRTLSSLCITLDTCITTWPRNWPVQEFAERNSNVKFIAGKTAEEQYKEEIENKKSYYSWHTHCDNTDTVTRCWHRYGDGILESDLVFKVKKSDYTDQPHILEINPNEFL